MRVCHMDHELRWRGGQRQVLLLLQGLHDRGVDVTLVTAPDSALGAKVADIGIAVEPIAVRSEVDFGGIRNVYRYLKSGGFDILHTHTSHAHGAAAVARAFLTRTRLVVHRRVDFRPGRDLVNRIKYRRLPDKYIAISREIARILGEAGVAADKIEVIHSAVTPLAHVESAYEEVRAEHHLPKDAILVGNVANLSDHKGHTYLIQAADILRQNRRDVYVLIVGRGELEEKLKRQVADLKLEKRVLFAGFREDVSRCLSAFDVFAMTSHTEGLCTSILDAMSIGVPVVATRAGGIPEIVADGENGLLAENRDPISIAERIVTMINDPDAAARYVAAGKRTVVERFGVDRMVDQTLGVYERLLGTNTR